jgi:hypothetical protein
MEHLAMEGFIHRDLAARNVMLKMYDPEDPDNPDKVSRGILQE